MKAKYISYQDTHAFSKLVLDYINDHPALKKLYQERPDLNGLKKTIENHKFHGDRSVLHQVLKEQYSDVDKHEIVEQNIDLLLNENTFTVTTGHQLNIFTGPLYFIYKIVSTINLAKELKHNFPAYNFVPVYWMATEDHDFEEINQIDLDGKTISWQEDAGGVTGKINTKSIAQAVNAYKAYLGISENAQKLAELIESAYLIQSNLADATRCLVNSLFKEFGLVIIDADNAKLKKLFSPIIEKDILEGNSDKNIQDTNSFLKAHNFPIQVFSRPINFFYLGDKFRERIIEKDGFFEVNNSTIKFSKSEIKEKIQSQPELFSPNVIMRPLYQEYILPNLAYIGGGAEVSYWLQLKANFDFYGINFPVLLLRNSAMVLDPRSFKDFKSLGISYEDLFLIDVDLENKWISKNTSNNLSLEKYKHQLDALYKDIEGQAKSIDTTLEPTVKGASVKTANILNNLEKKLLRAEKRRHQESLNKITNLKNRLFPSGILQERVLNLAPMYVNYGNDFIGSLIKNFNPLDGDFTIILPELNA